jgi:Sec-independent protein translocase protein TatA
MDSNFFGIGIGEFLLILVLVMIFVGPKKLPEIATKLGRMYRNLKRASQDLTSELTREAGGTADQKIENPFRKAASELSSELGSLGKSLEIKVDEPKQTDSKTKEQGKESKTQLTKEAGGTADQKIENPLRKVASDLSSELGSLGKSLEIKVEEPKQTGSKTQEPSKESKTQT